ncbi:Heat shock 70 kDa protein 12A [Entomortierella beljakovae]|nr:Heat shock 70 kDa protein 12A [Entomortierella beljakovae]
MDTPAASKYVQLYKFKPYLDESVALIKWENIVTIPTAISDYLDAIHKYVTERILEQFGPSFSQKKFRYCLTVPAIWSDKAKDVMRQAAIRANIISKLDHSDRLTLVSEPEAAALYCERVCDQFDLKHDDQFMICDAGGGTVDLIVYRIDDSNGGRHLSEVTKGHGASCGSMFIDLNLGNLLIEKFSSQTNAPFQKNIIARLVEKYAYELKPLFDGEDDQYLQIPGGEFFETFDDPMAIGMDNGYICLDATELKEKVFEPVVKQVLKLIDQQLESSRKCSAIFMVGGFGSSRYLLNRVRREFGTKIRTISSPHKPEAAVVCGAVYAGLNPKIVRSRITRRCYGTDVLKAFEHGIDSIDRALILPSGVCCGDRFDTIVKKGQVVNVDECFTRNYDWTRSKRSIGDVNLTVDMFSIDGDPPRYTTDPRVIHLAAIFIPSVFKASDPIGTEVPLILKMYFGLSEIKVEAHVKGVKHSTTLQFE